MAKAFKILHLIIIAIDFILQEATDIIDKDDDYDDEGFLKDEIKAGLFFNNKKTGH